jgi:hypothetical protein
LVLKRWVGNARGECNDVFLAGSQESLDGHVFSQDILQLGVLCRQPVREGNVYHTFWRCPCVVALADTSKDLSD